jgi:hypothetical protein
VRFLLAVGLCASLAAAQPAPPSRLTFSGGGARQTNAFSSYETQTAPVLGLSYGYRFRRWIEAEAGVFAALTPGGEIVGAHYDVHPADRFWWFPFGVRFVAPLYLGRIEFSGGGGGLFEQYTVGREQAAFGLQNRHGWGGYFVGAAAVALDERKRFWLGATPRWFLANPPYARDRWFTITGDFSFRF